MYDYVESLYVGKSDRFFDGILGGGIAKTIMTGGESAVILGTLDEKHSQRLNVYDTNDSAPTLTAGAGMGGGLVPLVPQRLGNIFSDEFSTGFAGNVYDKEGISPTLTTSQGGSREPLIVSSRGRNPNNPSDRSTNNLEQRLEVQQDGISNTLTTFQKDNYVLEQNPISTKGKKLDVAKTILSGYERSNMTGFNDDNAVFTNYQIRKLTPKECFRLMGVRDNDYDKLTVSNTQRYKQAGNSIVVDVLMAIFENMFIKDCKSNRLF